MLSDFAVPIPPWIFTKNKPLLQKVVLVSITGINLLSYEKSCLLTGKDYFTSILPHRIDLHIPASSAILPPAQSIYAPLLNIKVQGKSKPPPPTPGQDAELVENGYPMVVTNGKTPGWVRSVDKAGETECMIALDCEMCRTKDGLELTRISLVNEKKEVLLDEFVKPENEITDYLTQYSGISVATLQDVKTTLADIQVRLLDIINRNTILVGHSLENDFKAMKFIHQRVIDTSVLYPTGSTAKFPLKYLTKKYLSRVIQNHSGGHSSVEDAVAVMDLVKLKLARGKSFGTKFESYENLFSRLHTYKKRSSFIDTIDEITQFSANVVSCFKCSTDSEVVEKATKQVKGTSDFVCLQLNAISNHYKSLDPVLVKAKERRENNFDILKSMEGQIGKIWENMTRNSVMILLLGPGPYNDINRYRGVDGKQKDYLMALETAKEGIAFLGVKE
eukprot:gene12504-14677_t